MQIFFDYWSHYNDMWWLQQRMSTSFFDILIQYLSSSRSTRVSPSRLRIVLSGEQVEREHSKWIINIAVGLDTCWGWTSSFSRSLSSLCECARLRCPYWYLPCPPLYPVSLRAITLSLSLSLSAVRTAESVSRRRREIPFRRVEIYYSAITRWLPNSTWV